MSEPWKSSSFWLPASPANDNIPRLQRLRPEALTKIETGLSPRQSERQRAPPSLRRSQRCVTFAPAPLAPAEQSRVAACACDYDALLHSQNVPPTREIVRLCCSSSRVRGANLPIVLPLSSEETSVQVLSCSSLHPSASSDLDVAAGGSPGGQLWKISSEVARQTARFPVSPKHIAIVCAVSPLSLPGLPAPVRAAPAAGNRLSATDGGTNKEPSCVPLRHRTLCRCLFPQLPNRCSDMLN